MGILLLTTTGRKSGESRTAPIYFMRDGHGFVVVASNAGDPRDPAWYRNLLAKPDAEVMLSGERTQVRARDATEEERVRLWPKLVKRNSGYARYEKRTTRRIPIVILEPVP